MRHLIQEVNHPPGVLWIPAEHFQPTISYFDLYSNKCTLNQCKLVSVIDIANSHLIFYQADKAGFC